MAGEAIHKHEWKLFYVYNRDTPITECENCGDELTDSNENEECLGNDPYIGEENS